MAVQPEVSDTAVAVDVREAVRRQRLIRALADPDVLDELLLDPEAVAERFDISLTEPEVDAIRRAGWFASEWDRRLGDGRWTHDAVEREGQPRRVRTLGLEQAVDRAVGARIAREIVEQLPDLLRRAVDRVGAEALVEAERVDVDLPAQLRPLRRMLRELSRRVRREIDRELEQVALVEALVGRHPLAPAVAEHRDILPAPSPARRPIAGELRHRLEDAVTRAVVDAVERVRPAGSPWREEPEPEPQEVRL